MEEIETYKIELRRNTNILVQEYLNSGKQIKKLSMDAEKEQPAPSESIFTARTPENRKQNEQFLAAKKAAKKIKQDNPKLRYSRIWTELKQLGYLNQHGKPFSQQSVYGLLNRAQDA